MQGLAWLSRLWSRSPWRRRFSVGSRSAFGAEAEKLAAEYLASHGHRVLHRNWRCRAGEIDIVTRDGRCLVFVEVKASSSPRIRPEAHVTRRKQLKLSTLAAWYLRSVPHPWPEYRVDVVAVDASVAGRPVVRYHPGVFGRVAAEAT